MEVEVDSIAQKMLDLFAGSTYQHSEILVEAVIGTAVEKGTMSYIYNALNGFNNEIDFKVGDIVTCTATHWGYTREQAPDPLPEDYKTKWIRKDLKIGECKVVEINIYRQDKLKVEYTTCNNVGGDEVETAWVNHKKCAGTAALTNTGD